MLMMYGYVDHRMVQYITCGHKSNVTSYVIHNHLMMVPP